MKREYNTFDRANKTNNSTSSITIQQKQKTIESPIRLTGYALFSGGKTSIELEPAEIDSGITFVNRTFGTQIKLRADNLLDTANSIHANSTSLQSASSQNIVKTVEHFLAALHIYAIDNLTIFCDEELPNIDGSALDFCTLIENAGIKEQDAKANSLHIDEELVFGDVDNIDETFMTIRPYDGFAITLAIDFPNPIGKQSYTYTFDSPEQFKREIAPARSFNTLENIKIAQANGLVGSDIFDSHIIISDNRVINTKLRFEDEFVRHKILDIIGDLYTLGVPLKCKIDANRTSHKFNHSIVRSLMQKYSTKVLPETLALVY